MILPKKVISHKGTDATSATTDATSATIETRRDFISVASVCGIINI